MDSRVRRRGELHRLRDSDPAALIAMYRKMAQLEDERSLPMDITYVGIVEAILDHENLQHKIADESL